MSTSDRHRHIAALSLFWALAGCTRTEYPMGPVPEAAARASAIDWSHPQKTEIAMTEFDFRPDRLSLQEGQPYALHVVNIGSFSHTLTAPEFFRSVTFADGGTPRQQPDAAGTIELRPGESLDLALAPLQRGSFPMECVKPLHAAFGMRGTIDVQ